MSKTYYCQLCTSSWTILFPLYWLSDPIFQAWFGFANLKLWKNRAEFGQRPKNSWKIRAKNRTNRAKNRTNRAKNAKTQTFHIFHDFFAVQILSFHVFCEFAPCLNTVPIAMSQNHIWMRNYSLGVGASQIYSVISSPYSCFVVLTFLICREVAGYCGTLWESFFWDFSIMHPLIHAIQDVQFISIPLNQHFLLKVPRAIFLARAKNFGSGQKFSLNPFRPLLWPEDFVGIYIYY